MLWIEQAIETVVPRCIESLKGNPYGLGPPALRVARDHAAFIIGELLSAAIASDTLRPTLLAARDTIDPLIAAATDSICAELYAPREDIDGASVPQYAAAIEAAGSLGQTLKSHYTLSSVGLDSVLALTAGLAHAHEKDMAVYRANVDRDPNRAVSVVAHSWLGLYASPKVPSSLRCSIRSMKIYPVARLMSDGSDRHGMIVIASRDLVVFLTQQLL
jgi:hypothetical protein